MGFLLKLNTLQPKKKVKDFFDFFNGRTVNIRKKHIQHMGKPRDFAEKLLKSIKRTEEWMQMRGNAVGKYIKGGTRMELI